MQERLPKTDMDSISTNTDSVFHKQTLFQVLEPLLEQLLEGLYFVVFFAALLVFVLVQALQQFPKMILMVILMLLSHTANINNMMNTVHLQLSQLIPILCIMHLNKKFMAKLIQVFMHHLNKKFTAKLIKVFMRHLNNRFSEAHPLINTEHHQAEQTYLEDHQVRQTCMHNHQEEERSIMHHLKVWKLDLWMKINMVR